MFFYCLICHAHSKGKPPEPTLDCKHEQIVEFSEVQYGALLEIEDMARHASATEGNRKLVAQKVVALVKTLTSFEKTVRGRIATSLGFYRELILHREATDLDKACPEVQWFALCVNQMLKVGEPKFGVHLAGGAAVRIHAEARNRKGFSVALGCRPICDLDLRIDSEVCGFESFKSTAGRQFTIALNESSITKKQQVRFNITTDGQTIGTRSKDLDVSLSVNLWAHQPLTVVEISDCTIFLLHPLDLLKDKLKTVLTRTHSMLDDVSAHKIAKDMFDVITLARICLEARIATVPPKVLVKAFLEMMLDRTRQYRMRNLEQSPVVVYLDDDDLAARMLERLARVAFLHLQKGTKRCTAFVEAAGPHLGDYLEDMAAIASLEPPRLEQPALVKASKAYWSDVGDVLHPFTQGATGVVLHIVKEYTGVFNLRLMQDKSLNVDDLSLGRWFDVFAEGGPPMGQRGIPSLHEIVPLARHEAHRLVTLAKLCHGRVVAVLKLAVQKKGAGCTTIEKLDTSIKGVDSLQRKITGKLTQEIVLDQIGRVVENEGSLVHDVLRFTLVVAKDECYAAVLQGVISIIGKSDGFEVLKILDLWNADISYRGINVVCRFVEMLFEVQFHTTASFGAVVDTHVLYEEARRSDTELQRREELSLLMKERWSVVQDPRKK